MLPKISKLEFEIEEIELSPINHKSLEWDFDVGDFVLNDGRLIEVEGLEYIKTWIEKALRTRIGTLIYEDYGSEHHSLIGKVFDRDFIKSELERTISEALLKNEAIVSVSSFELDLEDSTLNIKLKVLTIYGDTEVILDGE